MRKFENLPLVLSSEIGKKMQASSHEEVTTVLGAIRAGDASAQNRLFELVYDDLRQVAAGYMRQERRDHTLQPTALIHEAFVRLLDQDVLQKADNRRYF